MLKKKRFKGIKHYMFLNVVLILLYFNFIICYIKKDSSDLYQDYIYYILLYYILDLLPVIFLCHIKMHAYVNISCYNLLVGSFSSSFSG
jgi:hypothetical protein